MKKLSILFGVYVCIGSVTSIEAINGVMFNDPRGRTGDKLLTYIKAKWVAWSYGFNFFFTPFKYSALLECHYHDLHISQSVKKRFKRICAATKSSDINILEDNILYCSGFYFCASNWDSFLDHYTWYGLIDNTEFRDYIRSLIAPRYSFKKLVLPKDRITVALHARKGSGGDLPLLSKEKNIFLKQDPNKSYPYSDKNYPFKYPPDSFYINALKILMQEHSNAPFYVYVFTDANNSEHLINKYKKMINNSNIVFDCRRIKNDSSNPILDDLFNMARFDCLIRPESHFSKIADIIGRHRIIIFPHTMHWVGNVLHASEVTVVREGKSKIINCRRE